jgi:hypothetical protein
MKRRLYTACALIAMAAALPAYAQTKSGDTADDKAAVSQASVPTNRLIDEYTKLAGSKDSATSLVNGLRSGTQVTLTSSDGKTTSSFVPPTGKMGLGEVNITLALAEKMMSANSSLTLQQALMGSGSTQGILQMRASHEGWGRIASSLGFKLGDVMRSAHASAAQDTTKRPERTSSASRPDKPARPDKPERPERPERPGR